MNKPLLDVKGLQVMAGTRTLIDALDLQVHRGELWCVLGPNGCGKTTLLHTLAGLRAPRAGSIVLKGKALADWPVGELARQRGLLPQVQHDAFSATVTDVVMLGRHPHLGRWAWESEHDRRMAHAALQAMDLAALAGHDVVINCAGYVADGAAFIELVDRVVTQAEAALGSGGRLWLFGGAAALDVPGTGIMGADLPGVPAIYQAHQTNFRRVAASTLDWSMMCPGPMVPSANGQARADLRISKDVWPFPRPGYTRWLARIALSLAFKNHAPELIVSYDDVAAVLLDHLPAGGRFSRARVGVALRLIHDDLPLLPLYRRKLNWALASRVQVVSVQRAVPSFEAPLETIFDRFEQAPIAAASIAQVHGATLPDGTDVVVKVQRPNLPPRVGADLRVMGAAARIAERVSAEARLGNLSGIVGDFAETLTQEMDFRLEGLNMDEFNAIFDPQEDKRVCAPRVYWERTRPHVLTMERFIGCRVDDVARMQTLDDPEAELVRGVLAWTETLLRNGMFHGDVHAGNLMYLDDGRIGFLDFGIVGRFDQTTREQSMEIGRAHV